MKELEEQLVDLKISHVVIKSEEHDFTKPLVSETQLCLPFTVHVYFHDAEGEDSYQGTLELFMHDTNSNKYYGVSAAHTLISDKETRVHLDTTAEAEQYEENVRAANKAVDDYDHYTGWSLHANNYGTIFYTTYDNPKFDYRRYYTEESAKQSQSCLTDVALFEIPKSSIAAHRRKVDGKGFSNLQMNVSPSLIGKPGIHEEPVRGILRIKKFGHSKLRKTLVDGVKIVVSNSYGRIIGLEPECEPNDEIQRPCTGFRITTEKR